MNAVKNHEIDHHLLFSYIALPQVSVALVTFQISMDSINKFELSGYPWTTMEVTAALRFNVTLF